MNSKKTEPVKDKLGGVTTVISSIAGIWLLGISVAYVIAFHDHSFGDPKAWGEFGDYFGGMLNPVIAFAALMALFTSIRIQQKELEDTRKQLAESTGAQEELVKATTQSQRIAYAASLIPLIEASRRELILMMESTSQLVLMQRDTKSTSKTAANKVFAGMRYTNAAYHDFLVADPHTNSFVQRMTDRLFSIYSLCAEITQKTNSTNVSEHYLHVVGELILDLQSVEAILTPTYSDREGYESLISWAHHNAD